MILKEEYKKRLREIKDQIKSLEDEKIKINNILEGFRQCFMEGWTLSRNEFCDCCNGNCDCCDDDQICGCEDRFIYEHCKTFKVE